MDTKTGGDVLSRVVRGEAERAPDRTVFVVVPEHRPPTRMTAAGLAVRGNQVAAAVAALALPTGVPVAVLTDDGAALLPALIAAAQLGRPVLPLTPDSGPDVVSALLTFVECGAVLVDEALPVAGRVGETAAVVRRQGVPVLGLGEILDGPERPDAGEHVHDPATPWLLAPVAGAEKDPKVLQVDHARVTQFRRVGAHLGYRPDDVACTGLPVPHPNALMATVLPAVGGVIERAVLVGRLDPARLWEDCMAYGVTTWSSYGDLASAVYNEPSSERDRAHGVRLVVSAGMPREIWRAFEQRFGVRVLEWYGTLAGGFACNPAGVGPVGSFGKPPADLVMDVVDEAGDPVPAGAIGELILRPVAEAATVAYYRDPEASARAVDDGWFRTGDLVTRDARGWLYRVSRG